MKVIFKKIETDLTQIGKEGYYPTQFIIDVKNLVEGPDGKLVDIETGLKFERNKRGYIYLDVDGFQYYCETGLEREFRGTEESRKEGFLLENIDRRKVDDTILLGEGMYLYDPENPVRVNRCETLYDDYASMIYLNCVNSKGKEVNEIFYAGGWAYSGSGLPDFCAELSEAIAVSKLKK